MATDAENAINDIKYAISEFGSTIKLRTTTEGAYDPRNPDGNNVVTDLNTKGIFKSSISKNIIEAVPKTAMESFEKVIIIDSDIEIEKDKHTIVYKDIEYEIVWFNDPILQDETLLYELLLKK